MKLPVEGRTIQHAHGQFVCDYPVVDAREVGETVLVLCDYMSFPRESPARNLFGYNRRGEELWRAEDIGCGAADAYTDIRSEDPLLVGNFAGFQCTIDIATGRVIETRFTK